MRTPDGVLGEIEMKKRWFLFGALMLFSVALMNAAVGEHAAKAGGLSCSDANCDGSAACASGGTVSSCFITCEGGGSIVCRRDNEID